jgi:hypothetical protein
VDDQTLWLLTVGGAMVAFATVIGIYDLLARRQHRRQREQQRRSA